MPLLGLQADKKWKKYLKHQLYYLMFRLRGRNFKKAILVFGDPRGGTTWLTEILHSLPNTAINWEPLHVIHGVVPKSYKFGWWPYIKKEEGNKKYKLLFKAILTAKLSNAWTRRFCNIETLLKSKYIITKFVRGSQLLPWFTLQFPELKHKPIYILRHPITSSMSQLKTFQKLDRKAMWAEIPYKNRVEIPPVINNEKFIKHQDFLKKLPSYLEHQIAIWCIHNVDTLKSEDQHNWVKIYYENMVQNPEKEIKSLINKINLEVDPEHFSTYNYSRPSKTNYNNTNFKSPKTLLESFLNDLDKDQLDRIQEIFDYFGLQDYKAHSAYPVIKT
ncbi:MAG: sulfotransferase [Bacteroidota bacterium]